MAFSLHRLFAMAAHVFGGQPSVSPQVQRRLDRQESAAMHRAGYIRNRSRYYPHQGNRERLRRIQGGFAGVSKLFHGADHDKAVAIIIKHEPLLR